MKVTFPANASPASQVAALFLLFMPFSGVAQIAPIRGYPPAQWGKQADLEGRLRALADASRIRQYMEQMAAKPHPAGSPQSKAVAQYALGLMKEWDLDAHIETFEGLIPYPTTRALEMVKPVYYEAKLQEPHIAADRDSDTADQLPPYNAYSASGDVTAPLVYVNYGLPEDYELLKTLGIDVKGKIVIARYGGSWRGVKPKVAQEHGAIGCLIYSDPHEDGYYRGDVYPRGAFRPEQGVQRGSVMDMALHTGDPLSPGWASEPGSKRLTIAEAATLMKIPVLPISYGDAKPLLENLSGPVAPPPWRGSLPITYHIGPGSATVHLKVDFDWSTRPVYDVIATIPGKEFADQWIIYGNHHDAWVYGASDPISGASSLLETARILAALHKAGWQPKRTIVLALWDGEEFGLIGSTEWVEKHKAELNRKALVYLNSDSNGKGTLAAAGSHTLEKFLTEVLRDVADPSTRKVLLETLRQDGGSNDAAPAELSLGPLGAGSDYVAFLDHVGIASLNLGFGGSDSVGVYHSVYDSLAWYQRFSDGDGAYGRALTQLMATSIARLSDSSLPPFEYVRLAQTLQVYTEQIQKQVARSGGNVEFGDIVAELARLMVRAKSYEEALDGALARVDEIPTDRLRRMSEAIYQTERALTLPQGLPGREWYKNQIYAPGLYTGYGAKTLPGVREAVEAGRWTEANQQAEAVTGVLHTLNDQLERLTKMLREK